MMKFSEWINRREQLRAEHASIKTDESSQKPVEKSLEDQVGKSIELRNTKLNGKELTHKMTFKKLRECIDEYKFGRPDRIAKELP